MKPMASVLDAQGREDVAAYYASQKVNTGMADPELVELGEKIYRSGN
jgi:cytochrome c553